MRMIDGVSGPAQGVNAALNRTRAAATGLVGANRSAAGAAGLLGATFARLGAIAAGYFSIQTVREGMQAFAGEEKMLSRIGNAARATGAQVGAAHRAIVDTAKATGVAHEGVEKAMLALVTGTNRSIDDAAKLLPVVTAVASVTNSLPENVAKAADALVRILKIAPADLQRSFEMMNNAAHAGSVQIDDLIAGLPRLAERAQKVGYTGALGFQKLLALVEAMSTRTVDANEALSQTETILTELTGRRMVASFKKLGIDINAEMERAAKRGQDQIERLAQVAWKAIGGNMDKLNRLVPSAEAQNALRNLFAVYGMVPDKMRQVVKASTELEQQQKRQAASAEADLNRLANAWHEFAVGVGSLASQAGVSTALTWLAQNAAAIADNFRKAKADFDYLHGKGGEPSAGLKAAQAKEPAVEWLEKGAANERRALEGRLAAANLRRSELSMMVGDMARMQRNVLDREIADIRRQLAGEMPSEGRLRDYRALRERQKAWETAPPRAPGYEGTQIMPGTPAAEAGRAPVIPVEIGPPLEKATAAAAAAGAAAGQSFIDALKSALRRALTAISPEINALQGALNFDSHPTITPRITPQSYTPGFKALGERQASRSRGGFYDLSEG